MLQSDGGGMEFHVTDVDSQTTYVSDLSPSDAWRRVSSALKGDYASDASVRRIRRVVCRCRFISLQFQAYSPASPPSHILSVKPPPPGLKMFGLDRKVPFTCAAHTEIFVNLRDAGCPRRRCHDIQEACQRCAVQTKGCAISISCSRSKTPVG